jgi:hypothetical protein
MPRLLSVLCALVLLPMELARAQQGTCSRRWPADRDS